ncbi:UEV domain-containing protein [Vararia minispora EC-137]|uniref:UEV domain-containing protein n=1 Tax=Vararia minispora EC-137 TaxID=1314806 RepID=A0ACB8QGI5_9AGAM|nr:UEV domain-containing protein [Vararia minispora EC-137]
MAHALTRQWLRQNTSLYPAADSVYADVDAALGAVATLRPKTDIYTYDDGRTQLLLCVHGLLPIQYRQSAYHIPIAVWLPRDYPRDPPIAYVVPTSDMLVKPGKHMDVSGRASIDYLQDWARKNEGRSLLALVQAMQVHFSRDPPLYSKPKQPPQTSPSQLPPEPGPRPPAVPPKPPAPASPPLLQPPASLSPPAPNGAAPIPPSVTRPRHSSVNPGGHLTICSAAQPALPPKPPSSVFPVAAATAHIPQPQPQPHSPPHHAHTRPSSVLLVPSPTQRNTPAPPPAPGPNSVPRWSVPPAAPTPPLPPLPPVHATTYVQAPTPVPAPAPPISPHAPIPIHVPAPVPGPALPPPNFLDADDDNDTAPTPAPAPAPAPAAPARPPNPELLWLHEQAHEKLRAELLSLRHALAHDAERLRAHQRDLLAGAPAIRDEQARLGAVRDVCAGVVERMRRAVKDAEERVAEMRRKGEPPVDELVCSTSIVHNQLIDLVADDNAIEDTMYHLHRALNAGRIDLDRFLRTTRVLAEEQFMKRALAEKILSALPLGTGGWA